MIDELITFLVRCPQCQREWTSALSQSEISGALDKCTPIRVYATCHGRWDLSENDREQLVLKLRKSKHVLRIAAT
jgi:hypothetical protein